MGTVAEGYMLRIRLSETLAQTGPNCAQCGDELEIGNVVFMDTKSMKLFHLKTCRREAVKNAAREQDLMPEELVLRFAVDRPAAYRIVAEVRFNGNGRQR